MAFNQDSESPDDFHFWTGVSTIAGALRRRVWLDMRKFQWTPNFYIILVGPPGIATKSTSTRTGMKLLESVPNIHFGPPSITWQKLADSLSEAIEHMKVLGQGGVEEFIPMSCITVPVSELGTFLKIEDTALVDVLVDLWDGQQTRWGHATKTSGTVDIKNPWLNIIACTTPMWLKANFPDNLIGGGLTSRIVFVFGDTKKALIPYPDEVMPSTEYHRFENLLKADLCQIAMMQGEYKLTPEARKWGHDWYSKHWTGERPENMASERFGGYYARKQTHIHKMAIVLAAARHDALIVERDYLIEAEAILASAEKHMIKVFDSIGMVPEARHAGELVSYVKAHSFLTSDHLYKLVQNIMSLKDYEETLKAAVRGGLLDVEVRIANGVSARGVVPGKRPIISSPSAQKAPSPTSASPGASHPDQPPSTPAPPSSESQASNDPTQQRA